MRKTIEREGKVNASAVLKHLQHSENEDGVDHVSVKSSSKLKIYHALCNF